jgi:hypothetical protein
MLRSRNAIYLALIVLFALGWIRGSSNTFLQQQNMFGLTGMAWQTPSSYYVPGTGNPAISTADYYHHDGLYWFRPYDLLNSDCGTAGSTIAASRGRYAWVASADHPNINYSWSDSQGFRLGYSNDPGVFPSRMDTIISFNNLIPAAQIASFTGSISGTTLTVGSLTGTISFNNNAIVGGAGVAANTLIQGQLTGTIGGAGTYTVNNSQSVGSESMTASQQNYSLYQVPYFVCNPDDASFPFYIYAEGTASSVQHEEGYAKSADLLSWTLGGPTHVTMTYSSTGSWSSFQRPVRDGVNSWHSVGFEGFYPVANVFGNGKWISSNGTMWTPNAVSLLNVCIPVNSTGATGAQPCPDSPAKSMNIGATPDTMTVSSQQWSPNRLDSFVSGTRTGSQWVARIPVDANFNVLASPPPVLISPAYAGNYPGPTYLQSANVYVEDGVAHYYAQVGFFPSSANDGLVDGATYANGGGLWQEGIDYYTEVVNLTAAANAAPVGVKASCNNSTVSLVWYNALPNHNYRIYRGTTAGSQTTLLGDVNGTSYTDSGASPNAVAYYKVVTLNNGTEEKSRVVSTYVSSSSTFINSHITRVLAAGADSTTINRTWLDSFYSWLVSNSLFNNLMFATMAEAGVAQNGSHVISTIYDLGTTRLPRGGDYTPNTTSTTYNATGLGGAPAWVNGSSSAQGYYGSGKLNNIRRKTQITIYGIYQKADAFKGTLITSGGNSDTGLALYHSAGTPGVANFSLSDATQTKVATATFSGSATGLHSIAGTFDGTTVLAYADASAGAGVTGLVIPSPNLSATDALTGQVGNATSVAFLGSGSQLVQYTYGTGYVFSNSEANFTAGALLVFDVALTPVQISSLDSLMKGHF